MAIVRMGKLLGRFLKGTMPGRLQERFDAGARLLRETLERIRREDLAPVEPTQEAEPEALESMAEVPPIPDCTFVPFFVAPYSPANSLTPEQVAAAEQADLAFWREEEKIKALYAHPAPRALNCGHRSTLHVRHEADGYVEDMLLRRPCGRSSCPYCWRRRLTSTYRRAAKCLLDAPPEPDEPARPGRRNLPRLGPVYVGETDWLKWVAFDRGIRRQHGGGCGRLRVRRADNRVFVVCAQPFPGSRPISPAEACALASAAIGELHTARHSFRLLGDWNDREPPRWRLVGKYEHLDFGVVQDWLVVFGIKARRLQSRTLTAMLWRTASEEEATALCERLLAKVCPSLAKEEEKEGRKSDNDPGDAEREDLATSFDDDPGDSPWR